MENNIGTDKNEFVWDVKELKLRNRKNVFQRGLKSYAKVILIVFIFSFIGTLSFASSNYIRLFDRLLGLGYVDYEKVERVGEYLVNLPFIKDMPVELREQVRRQGLYLALNHREVLELLELNHDYVTRNMGEVVVILIIAMLFVTVGLFWLRKTLVICSKRFYMERRFAQDVQMRRMAAPFGAPTIIRVFKTMITHFIVMGLWLLTIIGCAIKTFEYYFVPDIVAENPNVTWREARNLSSAMTKGYKMKLFKMHLSCLPYYLIAIIPFGHLLVTAPFIENMRLEAYFKLRSRPDIDRSLFVEDAFDGDAYVDRLANGEKPEDINPEFKLVDFTIIGSSFDEKDSYSFLDITALFFLFSFAGWLWEVLHHFFQFHEFVNRGFMHGPWLPIYGAGGTIVILLLNRYKENKIKLFVMTMITCGILEYLTSFALDYFKNAQYWDYKGMFLNLNGRICLAGLVAFAIGGFLGVYIICPFIKRMLELLGKKKTAIMCSILIVAFVVDLAFCIIKGPNTGEGVGTDLSSEAQAAFLQAPLHP